MAKAKINTDTGFLDGNLDDIKALGALYVAKFRSLTPQQKTEIFQDAQSVLNAYDPISATNTNNAIFGGVMLGVLLGKIFVESQGK